MNRKWRMNGVALRVCAGLVVGGMSCPAQRQMESLGRGVIALRTSSSTVYVGWRMLGTDPAELGFDLYRITGGVTNLIASNFKTSCNFVDTGASQSLAHSWLVQPVRDGAAVGGSGLFSLPANAPIQQYLNIALTPPADGVAYDGVPFTYNANDASVGDVDGDGKYEILLKWDPSNSHDNSQSGFTGNTFLDCYQLDGTRLWRIDLGPNLRSGAHYLDFMVFDFDGDGSAELMCRTAPGTLDGLGNFIGGAAKWQNANGPRPGFSNTADYRFSNPNGVTNGYVLAGPEFLTVFRGLNGAELATATYFPRRDPDNNNDNPTAARLNSVWGDGYGNRLDRFLAGVAYLDGSRPSAIFSRGYYTRAYVAAWDWRQGRLSLRWTFASDPANTAYRGQGAHSLSIGDADGDGRDEILYGAASIDDNGTGHYSTRLGHGDAEHFSDMNPWRLGQEIWMVHEDPGSYGPTGLEYRDAKTGALIFGVDGQNADVGRGVAYDIDPRHPGYEMWGARGGLMSSIGAQISSSRPGQMNFCVWWDADFLRETLDGTTVYKWNWVSSANNSILSPAGLSSNNGTKSTPCLSADLFGDWREEIIWRTADNLNLRIYSTTTPATNRFYTLMHDPQYRCAIAWQNTGYNQPPHPGFFLGQDMYPPPTAPISSAQLAWRGGHGNDEWSAANNWFLNGVWTNDVPASFANGDAVLFDLRSSNHTIITCSSRLLPGAVTVHSPASFEFVGSGGISGAASFIKAGPGSLTIANTNDFTGATFVRGGQLIVNGALSASKVFAEARGEPWGRARVGGAGWLGNGLVVERDCSLVVGPAGKSPGVLTVSNSLTELGGVLNQFDLSADPSGNTRSNDLVRLFGDLVLAGTNFLEITLSDGHLGGGVYPLIAYTGSLNGGLSNLVLVGDFLQPVSLTNPPGQIALLATIPDHPPLPASVLMATSIGASQINLSWMDNSSDENAFVLERSPGGTANFAFIATLPPNTTNYVDIGLTANTTYYYRLRGTNLAGFSAYSNTNHATTTATPPLLTWKGDGAANVWDIATTPNWLNGSNPVVYADGALVTFNNSGSNSPNLNLGMVVQPGSLTVEGSKNYTLGGSGGLRGDMALTKTGSGVFTLLTTNTFSGGIVLSNGALALSGSTFGSYTANTFTLGSGPVMFRGGTLRMFGYNRSDNTTGYGPLTNDLIVAAGQIGMLAAGPRNTISSRVTGGGTLTLSVDYVRGEVGGDWTGFTGKLTIVATTGTPTSGTTDDFRIITASGFPNSRLHLATNVVMYSRINGLTMPVGEFSADRGAILGANGGSGLSTQYPFTLLAGGLGTDSTNSAALQGAITLVKQGAGRWTLDGHNTYSGTTTVNGGSLVINGNQSAAAGAVLVNPGGTLAGVGIIGGNTAIAGILAPGTSGLGTLSFAGNLTFYPTGTVRFEISRNPVASDQVAVGGDVTFNGTLELVNISPELLQAGDNFQLFNAAKSRGEFTSMNLPALDAGLTWHTGRLARDGRLWVVSTNAPVLAGVRRDGGNIIFGGEGGTPNWNFYVLTTTNLVLPRPLWTPVETNHFDDRGRFSVSVIPAADVSRQYFCIQAE